jgi:serine phosphatase RsbU (regulator of sigma subunit)
VGMGCRPEYARSRLRRPKMIRLLLAPLPHQLWSPSPGEVLSRVNETLLARLPANMFVTCFYGVLDLRTGHLSYTNAGHDLPYLRHRGGNCEELRAREMPLGLMPGMLYEQKEIVLDASEATFFYSDGLVEAPRS